MRKIYLLICFLLSFHVWQSQAQNYCTPSYTGYGWNNNTNVSNPFFTHIKNVSFADLNVSTTPAFSPFQYPPSYIDYTTDTCRVAKGATYPLTIFLGNGANSQMLAVWIDYNQNNTFETSERVYNVWDQANVGSHLVGTNITIPLSAKSGSTRMRVGTKLAFQNNNNNIPDPCTNNDANASTYNWSQHFQDFTIEIYPPSAQTYKTSTVNQKNLDEVTQGSTDNEILQIVVENNPGGTLSPLNAGVFTFSTLGTSNANEISKAKLYYTGSNQNFGITNQVGSTISTPNGTFTINANTKLKQGLNYFWLVYDVSSTAVLGNQLDARCYSIEINSIKRVPSVINPFGSRRVGYCVSKGSQTHFISVFNVQMGNIQNNTQFGAFPPPVYTDYTYLKDTINRGTSDSITVQLGNGVNAGRVKAWIDFNHNGSLNDAGEKILDTFNYTTNQTTNSVPFLKQFYTVPSSAVCGPTRMRVSCQNYSVTNLTSCTNPTQIGEVEDYSVEIQEDGQPVSEFKAAASCYGNATDFYDASYTYGNYSISSWKWDFGDGNIDTINQNPSHTYANPGVYNVTLTTNTTLPGTPSTITRAVTIEKPDADFITNSSVYQVPITFNDITSGGLVIAWFWDFGDPQSGINNLSNKPTPIHTFDTAGVYDVQLIVITIGGCIDTIKKTITIYEKQEPIADFTANTFNPYIYESVSLIDQSVYDPDQFKWTFNPNKITYKNGTSDTSQNPVVSFDSVTTYNVFLEAKNVAGSNTTSKQFVVKNYTAPKVGFYANPLTVKVGESVNFNDTSLNDPTAWLWNFGDTISGSSNTSTLQFPTHQFANAGKYTISLKVSNPGGSDSIIKTQYINVTNQFNMCDNTSVASTAYKGFIYDSGGPNANYNDGSNCGFLIKPNCAGKIVLTFSSLDLQTNDYVQVFDGEDALTGKPLHSGLGFTGSTSPGILTANSGAIFIKEITDGNNNSTGFAASWTAFNNTKPKAKINADSVAYLNSPYHIRNATQTGTGNKYEWDIDNDGITDDTLFNTVYTYTSLGQQTIRLIATNCAGSDTTYKTINVKNPTAVPVVNFMADQDTVYPNDIITLTDLSTNGPTEWFWEFTPANQVFFISGDEYSQNPQIAFAGSGNYTVCLTAKNIVGQSIKVCKTNFIIVKEQALMCVFPYETTVAAGTIFDSGGPFANYSDNEDCNFKIGPCNTEIVLNFTKFNLSNGDYIRVYDGADNTGTPLFSGLGYTGSTIPNTFSAYSGNMYLEFKTNGAGNSSGFAAEWNSKTLQATKADFVAPDSVFKNSITRFINTSTNATSYEWDLNNDGTTDSTTKDGYYKYTSNGNQDITLRSLNCLGNDITIKRVNVVNQTTKPLAGFSSDFTIADTNQVVTLTDTSLHGPTTYSWSINPAANVNWLNGNTDHIAQVSFTDTGDYEVCLTVSNGFGNDQVCKTNYIRVSYICRPNPTIANGVGLNRVNVNGKTKTTPSVQGYTDYTNEGAYFKLEKNAVTDYKLEKFDVGINQSWRAWVDFNQDGDFDATNERIINVAPTSNQVVSGNFTVPSGAKTGITRMRVSVSYINNQNLPCNVAFGEVEDYFVDITNDQTPPVITLLGSNPDTLEQGLTYNDPGATAYDNVEGNISNKIVMSNNINNMITGTYEAKYNVSDSSGNKATEVKRLIYVLPDNTGPSITLNGNNNQYVEVHFPYSESGATAYDSVDGNVTSKIQITGVVDTSKLGNYDITYSVTDLANNSSILSRNVIVGDTTRPVISLVGKDSIYIFVGQTFTDPGVTVKDNYDIIASSAVVKTGTIDINTVGWYELKYNVQDKQNNQANTVTRWVNVDVNAINTVNGVSYAIFPNPTQGRLSIILPNNLPSANYQLFDATGRLLYNGSLQGNSEINIENLAKGFYTFKLFDMNGQSMGVKQLIKE